MDTNMDTYFLDTTFSRNQSVTVTLKIAFSMRTSLRTNEMQTMQKGAY